MTGWKNDDNFLTLTKTPVFKEFSFLKSESDNSQDLFNNWKKYKLEVPVYGAIMVDESLENVCTCNDYFFPPLCDLWY